MQRQVVAVFQILAALPGDQEDKTVLLTYLNLNIIKQLNLLHLLLYLAVQQYKFAIIK